MPSARKSLLKISNDIILTIAGETTNEILRQIVLRMGDRFFNAVDVSMLAERLNSIGVIGAESMSLLLSDVIADPNERCRCLLVVLQTIDRGEAFVKLRDALNEEIAYKWIVDEIDMISASAIRGLLGFLELLFANLLLKWVKAPRSLHS